MLAVGVETLERHHLVLVVFVETQMTEAMGRAIGILLPAEDQAAALAALSVEKYHAGRMIFLALFMRILLAEHQCAWKPRVARHDQAHRSIGFAQVDSLNVELFEARFLRRPCKTGEHRNRKNQGQEPGIDRQEARMREHCE